MPNVEIDGSYNIVVQAKGDGITIDIDRPHLTLNRRHGRPREIKTDLDLLNRSAAQFR